MRRFATWMLIMAAFTGSKGAVWASDVVIDWNNAALQAVKTDTANPNTSQPGPGWASRNLAMVQLAVYDAVNSASAAHQYQPYLLNELSPNASPVAAAAQAAHDVLAALYPTQADETTDPINQQLATSLQGISGTALSAGIQLGKDAATAILNSRINDGSQTSSNYTPTNPPVPGHWQPDPLHPGQLAWGPNWGAVKMFALTDQQKQTVLNSIPPPPALGSQAYADAYNQVKAIGASNSATRTDDETYIGKFWGYDIGGLGPPPIMYNEITQVIAAGQGNTMLQNARLFALTNLAMADSGIISWGVKFQDDFWRPITAIRAGDTDGNALTVADPSWTPLGAPNGNDPFTPPFPAYTSGHATFGSSLFQTITDFYGTDNIPFTFTTDEPMPAQWKTRSYTSLSAASWQNAESRIYLGIHWQFDADEGIASGNAVADDLFAEMMRPVPEPSTLALAAFGAVGLGWFARRRRRA